MDLRRFPIRQRIQSRESVSLIIGSICQSEKRLGQLIAIITIDESPSRIRGFISIYNASLSLTKVHLCRIQSATISFRVFWITMISYKPNCVHNHCWLLHIIEKFGFYFFKGFLLTFPDEQRKPKMKDAVNCTEKSTGGFWHILLFVQYEPYMYRDKKG